ncbi:hypothetical protein LDL08_37370 [Nonomuraea glycinis]|uniref:hypothetical protein n=1 Tax=Nonomuraea glycinis TaxID=2047744 RepID=UPI001665180C|nr:hypothetical protein [Nonomuraea glycinis]MCA2181847.1 hypothetical protein [Nonomuraea glycinis]
MPKRGQRSTVIRSAAQSAFLVQESGEVVHDCAGGNRMSAYPSDPSEGVLDEEEIELNLPLIIGTISAIAAIVQIFIDQVQRQVENLS